MVKVTLDRSRPDTSSFGIAGGSDRAPLARRRGRAASGSGQATRTVHVGASGDVIVVDALIKRAGQNPLLDGRRAK